ncbi:apolipoprotein N-acyltransferase, partial [bacterium]
MRPVLEFLSSRVLKLSLRNYSLCILCALLLILSFPDFNLWICAWFGFLPLFFVLEGKNRIKAFLFSYFTGVIFWAGTIYWLIHVTLPGTVILILYLALYFGFFGLIVSCSGPLTLRFTLLIPSAWVLLEYLRSHLLTGFPWALLGYSQYLNLPVIQIADITGVWGVSFLVMLVNAAVYSVLGSRFSVLRKKQIFLLSLSCVLLSLIYGYYRIYRTPNTEHRTPIKISVIQANIPQEMKWDARVKDFIFGEYFALTRQAAADKPDLIIWPEAASPAILEEEAVYFDRLKAFTRQIHTPLLLGAVVSEDSFYFNSALLLSKEGSALGRYDKLHLVPFGEYIPLKNIFGFLQTVVPIGEVAFGKDYTIFQLSTVNRQPSTNFAVLICFEDLFPELSREFSRGGADFLVNITNDAWYKKTSAPYQHLQASVFRAVENRLPLARAANTGVSAFISPQGRIISLAAFT